MIHVEANWQPALGDIGICWAELAIESPGNPFLSDAWLMPWFERIAVGHQPVLVRIVDGHGLVAFGVLHRAEIRRRGLFKRTQLYLNEYPLGDHHMVIEYNGLVCRRGCHAAAWTALMQWLVKAYPQWDECCFNAIEPDQTPAIAHAAAAAGLVCLIEKCQRAPYGDLCERHWHDVERMNLSSNRRRQIRRAMTLYREQYGEVSLRPIVAREEFADFWRSMAECHASLWEARGCRGAFANPVWLDFNRALCLAGLADGTAQLLRITAGAMPIGYLYNLVAGAQVFNIQSAFRYESDNRLKPGFVCHYLAMQFCHGAGLQKYHYLGGGEDYKASLSAREDWLTWLVVRKRPGRFLVEDFVVAVVRVLRGWFRRAPG